MGDPLAAAYAILERYLGVKIRKIEETYASILVPLKHRVDTLNQLCPAGLINAASVDPGIFKVSLKSHAAGLCDLRKALCV